MLKEITIPKYAFPQIQIYADINTQMIQDYFRSSFKQIKKNIYQLYLCSDYFDINFKNLCIAYTHRLLYNVWNKHKQVFMWIKP